MDNVGVLSMPAEQYRAADGISNSMLSVLAEKTPAHFRAKFITKELEDEETDALRLGSITHRVILEPDTMEGAFYVRPEGLKFTTKEGKGWRDSHADRHILDAEEAQTVTRMRDAVWRHPMAKRLLKGAETERSLFAKDSHKTLRKARLDALTAGNIIPDLKTCLSASPDKFEKAILDHGYHRQAAYYVAICNLLGIEKEAFAFICVEKSAPYCVAVYSLTPEVLEFGRMENERNLAVYRECMESGEWPGFSDAIESIGIPPWAMKQLEGIA